MSLQFTRVPQPGRNLYVDVGATCIIQGDRGGREKAFVEVKVESYAYQLGYELGSRAARVTALQPDEHMATHLTKPFSRPPRSPVQLEVL